MDKTVYKMYCCVFVQFILQSFYLNIIYFNIILSNKV